MNKPTRVVHIMRGFNGGIASFIMNKAKELDDDIVFDVICLEIPTEEFVSIIESKGGKVLKVVNPKKDGWVRFYKQVNRILQIYPNNTLIHSHIHGHWALPFYLIAKSLGMTRFAIHAHTAAPFSNNKFIYQSIQRLNRKMGDQKISCGEKASENIFNLRPSNNKIFHIPNSIDEDSFFQQSNITLLKKNILNVEDNRLILGSIGRLKTIKNQKFLLQVLKELKETGINFICYLAGSGPLETDLKTMVYDLGLENEVVFLGFRSDIPDLLSMTDIFLLPSLHEGLPTVVVEAQAANTYSIVSDRVTNECDLDLGLVTFLPLCDKDSWVKKVSLYEEKMISTSVIYKRLEDYKFTNQKSFDLYKKFIFHNIDFYNI